MKKVVTFILVGLLALSMAACNGDTTSDIAVNPDSPYIASEDPLTLSIHLHYLGSGTYDNSYEVFQKATEYTNISLNNIAPKASSNSAEAYDLMVASGDWPDIACFVSRNRFMEDGASGAYIPLEDLIDEYAPNIKAFFEKYPDAKRAVTAPDGHIYGISHFQDQEIKVGQAWYLRLDWLEKLGLEIPQTKDELHDVLLAFAEQDPNGNGQKDEIPYFSRGKSPANMLPLWNAHVSSYLDNGKVKFGPVQEEFKTAMKEIQQWYQEGIIDQEIFTRDSDVRDMLLNNDQGGCTLDWVASTSTYNKVLQDKIEGFNFAIIEPPATDSGERVFDFKREIVSEFGWGISQTNKHPVETMKYFDFWFSTEGSRLMNYGIEGEDWTLVDGEPKYTDKVLNSGEAVIDYLNKKGAICQGIGFPMSFDYEKQAMSEEAQEGLEMYQEKGYIGKNNLPPLNYEPDELTRYNKINGDITTYFFEVYQKWTMGDGDIDAEWDSYVSRIQQLGLDEMMQIQQEAYDRFMQ